MKTNYKKIKVGDSVIYPVDNDAEILDADCETLRVYKVNRERIYCDNFQCFSRETGFSEMSHLCFNGSRIIKATKGKIKTLQRLKMERVIKSNITKLSYEDIELIYKKLNRSS